MAVSLRTEMEVNAALNFVDTHDSTPGLNSVYVGISKQTPWANELNPDIPLNNTTDKKVFWDNLIGLQRVQSTDIAFVVPRKDWTTGTEYYLFDETSETAYSQDFYVVNTNYEVFQCVGKSGGIGSLSTIMPTGHNNGAVHLLADGYSWKFLYDISTQDVVDMVTPTWLFVNWGDSQSTNQNLYGDNYAVHTLGAKYTMIRIVLGNTLPESIYYRQVAVVRNPLDQTGTAIQYGTVALPAALTLYSGQMLYLENKYAIYRTPAQTEELKLVVTW